MKARLWKRSLAVVVLALSGCGDDADRPDAEPTRTLVIKEARGAIALAAAAVSGTNAKADARWFECVQGLAWKYQGGGTFKAPDGDRTAQLAAIRAALVRAGYKDTAQVADKVAVERGIFRFVIWKFLGGQGRQPIWRYGFTTPCTRFSSADKAAIKAVQFRRDTILP